MARPLPVVILLYDGVNAVDVAGPAEAFAAVRQAGGSRCYTLQTWSLGGEAVRTESGLRLLADAPAPEQPRGDLLIVPGGSGVREPGALPQLSNWLRVHQEGFRRIAAVCTGAYVLAEAGLADGRTLATHWAHAADLQRRYPRVRVDADALFVSDGRFHSSGGVTAGIDLALDLIEADFGPRAAMQAARELVVYLRRSGNQAQFSAPLRLQSAAPGRLEEVCLWAASNLDADLSVEALAARAGLSSRQFGRRFREAFSTPPARYIKLLRLDSARTLLGQGAPVALAAEASGFASADAFRRAFESHFDIAPSEYQRRFKFQRRQP